MPLSKSQSVVTGSKRPTANAQRRMERTSSRFSVGRWAFGVCCLKKATIYLAKRRFRQMQRERFQPAQIQLQGRVFFRIGAARFLKLRVGFSPAFLAIKNDPVPETIAPGEVLRF